MNFYPIYRNKKLLPWIKWWLIKGNKVTPKHLSEWIDSAEAITLTGVYKGSPLLYLNLKGNTSQTGTPSPEAPVPVNVVKEDNYININDNTYRVDLGGKNLLNIKDNLRNSPSNGITTVYNNDNSITISGTTTGSWSNLMNNTTVNLKEGTYTLSISEAMPFSVYLNVLYNDGTSQNPSITRGNTSVTWTTDKVITRYRLDTSGMNNNTVYNKTFYVQLETGSQATPFSPYVANPIELCKIGDYQDVIYKENNKWYVDKYINKIVLNGSEPTISADTTGLLWCFSNILSEKPSLTYGTSGVLNGYCDYYLPSSLTVSRSNGKRICIYPNQTVWITKDDLTVLSDFRSFLNSHNVTLYYVLAESTTTEITETNLIAQLEAIYNAKLQSGTNTITQTPSDLPFYLNFRYYEKG